MKVFFDTNVYVAEALLGAAAERMVNATFQAKWRVFISEYVLDEIERVLIEYLGFSNRLGRMARQRCRRRASIVHDTPTGHIVPHDPDDSPILQAALRASVDFLVSNDTHLLKIRRYQGIQIISLSEYYQLLVDEGLLQ